MRGAQIWFQLLSFFVFIGDAEYFSPTIILTSSPENQAISN